jgi:glyoxylase-like metal-dependent hydrolase (beta-lactamase superfamily II)
MSMRIHHLNGMTFHLGFEDVTHCLLVETAAGLALRDVQHIVLTHLHIDHAGGQPDVPWAQAHVHAAELQAATRPRRASLKARF